MLSAISNHQPTRGHYLRQNYVPSVANLIAVTHTQITGLSQRPKSIFFHRNHQTEVGT